MLSTFADPKLCTVAASASRRTSRRPDGFARAAAAQAEHRRQAVGIGLTIASFALIFALTAFSLNL